MALTYIPVAGTHGWLPGENPVGWWWHEDSPFTAFMAARGLTRLGRAIPFWDTSLVGMPFAGQKHRAWRYGGENFEAWVRDGHLGYEELNVICHSHGLQVAAYALATGRLQARRLVSIGSPVRKDMEAVYDAAAPFIAKHLHLYDPTWRDHMRWLGGLFDGRFGFPTEHPWAENRPIRGIGHSGPLVDTQHFHYLDTIVLPFLEAA